METTAGVQSYYSNKHHPLPAVKANTKSKRQPYPNPPWSGYGRAVYQHEDHTGWDILQARDMCAHLQALDDARVEAFHSVQAVALVAAHRLNVIRAHLPSTPQTVQ